MVNVTDIGTVRYIIPVFHSSVMLIFCCTIQSHFYCTRLVNFKCSLCAHCRMSSKVEGKDGCLLGCNISATFIVVTVRTKVSQSGGYLISLFFLC
jgi:hypothetical protein